MWLRCRGFQPTHASHVVYIHKSHEEGTEEPRRTRLALVEIIKYTSSHQEGCCVIWDWEIVSKALSNTFRTALSLPLSSWCYFWQLATGDGDWWRPLVTLKATTVATENRKQPKQPKQATLRRATPKTPTKPTTLRCYWIGVRVKEERWRGVRRERHSIYLFRRDVVAP